MPTIPFRPVSDIEHDIPVCSPDRDLCQLRINEEGRVACFESLFFHTTSTFAATHNLSLENYNDGLEWLGAHYSNVCRSEYVDTSDTDNRFELFSYRIMNRSDVRTEVQEILDADAVNAAAGAGLPAVLDPNHFPTCEAEVNDSNGGKAESIWLTAAEAEYLSSKFPSHDRMLGCLIEGQAPEHNGQTQFWITTTPETLGGLNENMLHFSNGVIDKIKEDIRNGKVPEGVRSQEIFDSLVRIREANQYISGIRAQISAHNDSEVIRKMQERQGWWSMMQGFAIILLFAQPLLKSLWQKFTGRVRTTDFGETIRSRILAERAAGRTYDVLGRDREARDGWVMTDTASYRNIMVDAPTQVGKDEVVRKMIIMKEMAALGFSDRGPIPEEFVNAKVVKINAAEFQRGTSLRGNVADKVAEIADWARKGPVIVYVSEIDLILLSGGNSIDEDGRPSSNTESPGKLLLDLLGEDSAPESWIHRTLRRTPGIGRYFRPPTTGIRDNIIMIGTTSRYQEVLEKYPDLQARFNQLRIDNLHLSEMVNVIYDGMTRTEYETRYRVKISKDVVDAAARIAEQLYRPVTTRTDRYTGETRNLNRFPAAKQVLEGAARIARERSRASTGSGSAAQSTEVTLEDVIKSAEQRMNRSLDRAAVDVLLHTENIDSLELLPDNEPPTEAARGPVPPVRGAIEPRASGSSAADSSSDGTSRTPPREPGTRGGPAGRFTEVTMNEFFGPQGARTQETTYPAPAVCETATNDTATRVAESNAPAPTLGDATRFGLIFGGAMTVLTELYKATVLGNRRDVNEVESTTIMVGTGAALDSVMGNELTWGSFGRLAQGFVEFLPAFFMTGVSNSRAAQAARTTEGAGVIGVANITSGAIVTAAGSEAASQVAATAARQAVVAEAAGVQTAAPAAARVLTSTPAMGLTFSLFYDRGIALGTVGDTFWGQALNLCTSDGTDCSISGWGAEKLHTVVDPVSAAAREYVIAPVSAGVGAATAFVGETATNWYAYDANLLGIREYTDAAGRQLREWYEYDSQLLKDAGEAVTGAINYVGDKANQGLQWAGNKVGQGLEAANDASIGVLNGAAELITGGEYEYDPTWWDIF